MSRSSAAAHLLLAAILVASAACGSRDGSPPAGRSFSNGHEVVKAMHDLYRGHWPPYVTFTQRTIRYPKPGVRDTTVWHEALALGKLRIDIEPLDRGDGTLYVGGRRYTFRSGRLADSATDTNPLAVLLSDVYLQPVERSAHVLDSLGIDLSVARMDSVDGRPVWIVGAARGDTTSPQFWVDADRLLAVRDIQPLGDGRLLDATIGGWQPLGDGWVETHLDLRLDGRLFQTEEYSDIRAPDTLDPALFDPGRWAPATSTRYWEEGDST